MMQRWYLYRRLMRVCMCMCRCRSNNRIFVQMKWEIEIPLIILLKLLSVLLVNIILLSDFQYFVHRVFYNCIIWDFVYYWQTHKLKQVANANIIKPPNKVNSNFSTSSDSDTQCISNLSLSSISLDEDFIDNDNINCNFSLEDCPVTYFAGYLGYKCIEKIQ
jgi:hypothetical protein